MEDGTVLSLKWDVGIDVNGDEWKMTGKEDIGSCSKCMTSQTTIRKNILYIWLWSCHQERKDLIDIYHYDNNTWCLNILTRDSSTLWIVSQSISGEKTSLIMIN